MSIRKLARRLLSPSSVQGFWAGADHPSRNVRLGTDAFHLEDRTVPTVTAAFDAATGILSLTNNNAADEALQIDGGTTTAGFITVTKTTNNITLGTGVADAGGGNAKVAVAGVKIINMTTDATKVLNFISKDVSGATDLRTLNYTGSDAAAGDNVNLTAAANANVYYNMNTKGGADNYTAPSKGIVILSFTAQTAASTLAVDTTAAATPGFGGSATFLNYKALDATTPVSVNLSATTGGTLSTYAKSTVTLKAGTTDSIIGAAGGAGDDILIGNAKDNYFTGGLGNDNINGGDGNDQLNTTIDFSPALAGTKQADGTVTQTNTTVIDVTKFPTAKTTFRTAMGTSVPATYASDVYDRFGYLNFGQGAAFVTNASFTATELKADGDAANNFTVATNSSDSLFGGNGDDALYGFNGSAMTAYGGAGKDIISGNLKSLPGTADGGAGDDVIAGAAGWYMLGGDGNDNLSFTADANPAAVTYAIGGAGNDTISANSKNLTVDATTGTDTVTTFTNDASLIIMYNSTTNFTGGGGLPLAQLTLVQKATR